VPVTAFVADEVALHHHGVAGRALGGPAAPLDGGLDVVVIDDGSTDQTAAAAAVVYGALALGWLALSWRDPRAGLAFSAGPLLAPFGGLALLPLAVQPARGLAVVGHHDQRRADLALHP